MSTHTVDSAYAEIATLSGSRAEMERERYLFVKTLRCLRAVIEDTPAASTLGPDGIQEIETAIARLEKIKRCVWDEIESTDAQIQRLTDLAQNGAFNA